MEAAIFFPCLGCHQASSEIAQNGQLSWMKAALGVESLPRVFSSFLCLPCFTNPHGYFRLLLILEVPLFKTFL